MSVMSAFTVPVGKGARALKTPSVFTRRYWAQARGELHDVRMLALAGVVCAAAIVLESVPVYVAGPSLKIYFSFLAVSLGCACYGPFVGMAAGFAIDTLGFLLSGYGEPYFPGYTVTAVLSGLICGLFLYRQKITVPRLIALRLVIDYGSNVLLGSVWKAMLYGKGYLYYAGTGLVKNTILLPAEVVLLWAVFRAAERSGLVRRCLKRG